MPAGLLALHVTVHHSSHIPHGSEHISMLPWKETLVTMCALHRTSTGVKPNLMHGWTRARPGLTIAAHPGLIPMLNGLKTPALRPNHTVALFSQQSVQFCKCHLYCL